MGTAASTCTRASAVSTTSGVNQIGCRLEAMAGRARRGWRNTGQINSKCQRRGGFGPGGEDGVCIGAILPPSQVVLDLRLLDVVTAELVPHGRQQFGGE